MRTRACCSSSSSTSPPPDHSSAACFPSDTLAAALIEHVRRELGPIATSSSSEFVASLPKTRSGRILRRFLKAKEAGVDAGDISTMEG